MDKIAFDQIRKTYNGRVGCACGCNGTYTLPSHVSIADANKDTGWDAYDASSVSDRRAKIALNKVNAAIDRFGPLAQQDKQGFYQFKGQDDDGNRIWFCYSNDFAAVDINDRATTVYFQKGI